MPNPSNKKNHEIIRISKSISIRDLNVNGLKLSKDRDQINGSKKAAQLFVVCKKQSTLANTESKYESQYTKGNHKKKNITYNIKEEREGGGGKEATHERI